MRFPVTLSSIIAVCLLWGSPAGAQEKVPVDPNWELEVRLAAIVPLSETAFSSAAELSGQVGHLWAWGRGRVGLGVSASLALGFAEDRQPEHFLASCSLDSSYGCSVTKLGVGVYGSYWYPLSDRWALRASLHYHPGFTSRYSGPESSVRVTQYTPLGVRGDLALPFSFSERFALFPYAQLHSELATGCSMNVGECVWAENASRVELGFGLGTRFLF